MICIKNLNVFTASFKHTLLHLPTFRARTIKLLGSPRINSRDPIPPGCVAWQAGTTTLFQLGS
jgi:hypothetical protein